MRASITTREVVRLARLEDPEHCDNCRKPLYTIVGTSVLCSGCDAIGEPGKQNWKCLCCGMVRVYGLIPPVDRSEKQLNCARCEDVTPHTFAFMAPRRLARA